LRLEQHVKRTGGLVEHDEIRLQHSGARNRDALALAAGKFVRIAEPRLRIETICMSRRNGRMFLNVKPWMLRPRKTIGPSEEISRSSARPSVVLPEPDSPTTPSVSPCRTARLTPSTALMWPTVERNSPRLIGNHTFRSSAEITTGDSGRGGAGSGLGSAASSAFV
jgi:hypothetical protein